MRTLAGIFAIVYALPELTLFFAWSSLAQLAYSASFGIAATIVVHRLKPPVRTTSLILGGAIFAVPIPMILPMLSPGLPMDISNIWIGRAIWFAIATAALLITHRHLIKRQAPDRDLTP